MPLGLKRYQDKGHLHFLTFSCYHREPYFSTPHSRDLFELTLEKTRQRYKFRVIAYVVMPEHIHLLVSEPETEPLSKAIQSLKLSISKQSRQRPFWQDRYHDFNVFTLDKLIEKRDYIHRNPVTRGLVSEPGQWPHSSFPTYISNTPRTVHIDPR